MSGVKPALIVGFTLAAIAIGAILATSPVVVLATNSVPVYGVVVDTRGDIGGCQTVERLPRGTSAIRLSVAANAGPQIAVKVLVGSELLSEGKRTAGWGADETVTVSVRALAHPVTDPRICVALGPAIESIALDGTPVAPSPTQGRGLDGAALRMEFLRVGPRSWASLVAPIARTLGWGHAASGSGTALFLLATMVSVVLMASYLTVRDLP